MMIHRLFSTVSTSTLCTFLGLGFIAGACQPQGDSPSQSNASGSAAATADSLCSVSEKAATLYMSQNAAAETVSESEYPPELVTLTEKMKNPKQKETVSSCSDEVVAMAFGSDFAKEIAAAGSAGSDTDSLALTQGTDTMAERGSFLLMMPSGSRYLATYKANGVLHVVRLKQRRD